MKTRIGELSFEAGYPTKETSQKLCDEIDFQRACQAYMWSFPTVSAASVRLGVFRDLGLTYNDILLYQNFLDDKLEAHGHPLSCSSLAWAGRGG